MLVKQFRDAMSMCASAVYVVTTCGDNGRFGMTMTAIASVTDEPPTLLLCVNRQSRIHDALHNNRHLCVNVLSHHQQDVAIDFAGLTQLNHDERFECRECSEGVDGQPHLKGALAWFDGHIISDAVFGTHTVFFVEVDKSSVSQEEGVLTYFQRQFYPLVL